MAAEPCTAQNVGYELGYATGGQIVQAWESGLSAVPLKKLPKLCEMLNIPKTEFEKAAVKDVRDFVRVIFKDVRKNSKKPTNASKQLKEAA